MTDVLQIYHSLVREFKRCIPDSRHYLGRLPENHRSPCFLYLPVFQKDHRVGYFFKETALEIQILYIGAEDGYNGQDFEDKMEKRAKLQPFLAGFLLPTGDRNLSFTYEFTEADDHLAIHLSFRFRDPAISLKFEEEQSRPPIENVVLNKEELTNGITEYLD